VPLTRRDFFHSAVAALFAAGNARTIFAAAPYDAFEKSIGELQAALTAGKTTAVELVRFYLARIAAYDQAGPRLNAVLFVNPNAIRDARTLDTERKKKGPRGPLHGIPVLLKDNFDTSDMPTTGGSLALTGVVPGEDAFQVRKLRQAGAVILGKVNLHELALGLTTVSSLGGQTLDPYDPARAPGGSSGGSGVAVAANFAAFAMGTDTSGSIRIPSSHNAIVGLRPSAGLSSRSGIIPFGHTQDTGGPMAKTVADVALILDATAGFDSSDPVTATGRDAIPRTYTSSLKADALDGARVGVLAELFGTAAEDREVGSIVLRAVDDMKKHGATAIDVTVPDLTALLDASNLLSQELKFDLGDYLRRSPGAFVNSVEELLASGLHTAQFSGFLEAANAQPDGYLTSDDYRKRLAARERLGSALLGVMDDHRLDAIVYPTARRIAPLIGGNQLGSNAALSAQTGFPAITVPAGFTPGGFPVGVEMIGRRFAEPRLIALAYSYEQATRHRRPSPATPPVGRQQGGGERFAAAPVAGEGDVTINVVATGAQAVPRTDVTFELGARMVFEERTNRLSYTLTLAGESRDRVAGVYLHRRANRPNGGVAQILAKSPRFPVSHGVTLLPAEAADLKAGKCYISAITTGSPLRGARANIVWP
jgi:Asp-tRNA(Asn)/Glu-tRNA(Gln) amidotransferase A subunit family amidase